MDFFLPESQFRHALRRGHGRALLHLKHNQDHPYEDELLYACTHFTGYDAQVDGYPTAYLWTALRLAGCTNRFRERILNAFTQATDRRDMVQLLGLLDQYARNGDDGAIHAIRQRFDAADPRERDDFESTIVRRQGLQGLLFVAKILGRDLIDPERKDRWIDLPRYLIPWMDEARATAMLERAAVNDEDITRLVRKLDADHRERNEWPAPLKLSRDAVLRLSFRELREQQRQTLKNPAGPPAWWWGKEADEKGLREAANCLITAEDSFDRLLGVYVFTHAQFPGDPQPLIDLVANPNEKISYHAIRSLRSTSHRKIREIFERSLDASLHLRDLFGLLRSNWKPGDAEMISSWIGDYNKSFPESPTDEDVETQHGIGFDLLEIFEMRSEEEASDILAWIFDETPCKNCRCRAFEALLRKSLVDQKTLIECTWDQPRYIRAMAHKALRE